MENGHLIFFLFITEKIHLWTKHCCCLQMKLKHRIVLRQFKSTCFAWEHKTLLLHQTITFQSLKNDNIRSD